MCVPSSSSVSGFLASSGVHCMYVAASSVVCVQHYIYYIKSIPMWIYYPIWRLTLTQRRRATKINIDCLPGTNRGGSRFEYNCELIKEGYHRRRWMASRFIY